MNNKNIGNKVAIAVLGAGLARTLSVVLIPLVAAAAGPVLMGLWVLIHSISTAIIPLSTLRLETAIVLPEKDTDAKSLAGGALVGLIATSVLLLIIGLVLVWATGGEIGSDNNRNYGFQFVLTVSIVLLCIGLDTVARQIYIRQQRFGLGAIGALFFTASWPIVLLFFHHINAAERYGFTPEQILLASVALGFLVAASACIAINRTFLISSIKEFNIRHWISLVVRYKNYPLYVVPYRYSAIVVERALIALVIASGGIQNAGMLLLAQQMSTSVATMCTMGLNNVWYGYFSRADDKQVAVHVASNFLVASIRLGAAVVSMLGIFLVFFAEYIFSDAWISSIRAALLLLPACFFIIICSWLDRSYDVLMRQKTAVVLQLISDALLLAVLGYCFIVKTEFTQTIIAYSSFIVVYNIFWLFFTLRLVGLSFKELSKIGKKTILWVLLYISMFSIAIFYSNLIISGAIFLIIAFSLLYHFIDGFGVFVKRDLTEF